MGKKRRGHPDVEEILGRPWCYYCERDFEDLKLLISHQKAKHFKCDRCGRRLNTAGGLSVHLNQVHKENLSQVENALPNRQGLEVEIFGMEGIPQEILDQHRNRIIQNFYQAQEDRRVATGNPLPGQAGQDSRKKLKVETADDLKRRLEEFRTRRKTAGSNPPESANPSSASPGNFNPPYQTPQPPYEQHSGQPAYPGQAPPASYGYPTSALPARPSGNLAPAPGLPQRPTQGGSWSGPPGAAPGAASGDDIDQLIRMAEAGIKPPQKPEADDGDKKAAKKEKKTRMLYDDAEISPEERMAALPRYVFSEIAAA
ncbi:hypothetical protein AK830_g10617 [Neonectria ditissima]|uniref:C2H2-type domain-containing protein n=1 Tax=Neonectria ditissima TaxID=78410 RepID=A0A0N8H5E4_9HYPO|nr:hypothetical protein AK830_g10617 [Neonectria ditissima]